MGYAVAHVHGHVPNGCRDRPRVGYVVSKSKETCAVPKGGRGPSGNLMRGLHGVDAEGRTAANGLAMGPAYVRVGASLSSGQTTSSVFGRSKSKPSESKTSKSSAPAKP
jgi:hypothetical protein